MVTQPEARKFSELLEIAKATATHAGSKLGEIGSKDQEQYGFDSTWPREIKAKADKAIEEIIINELISTGLPILSEEAGEIGSYDETGLRFIIDPIDGTANFVRSVGDSAISIALFEKEKPLFGVLYLFPEAQLAWGGPSIGSYIDDGQISVSSQINKSEAVLCTGIPARLDLTDQITKETFLEMMLGFSKVRMLGAASISLLHVAKGSADCYSEQDVMIWDVAAGLAILAGAGGAYRLSSGSHPNSCSVIAQNGCLFPWSTGVNFIA